MSPAALIALIVLIATVLLPIVWFVASKSAAGDMSDPHH